MINWIFNALQLIGGFILSFGYIPQILQILRTNTVRDLNFKTFATTFLGVFLFELYAVRLVATTGQGVMFLVTNSMSLVVALTVCILILYYRKGEAK